MQTLQPTFPSYKGPLLQILAEWKGTPQPFGSAYSMAIGDTVTQGTISSQGCFLNQITKSLPTHAPFPAQTKSLKLQNKLFCSI